MKRRPTLLDYATGIVENTSNESNLRNSLSHQTDDTDKRIKTPGSETVNSKPNMTEHTEDSL